ncbi:hypothetical protein [Bacillus sp. SD088]|uniref:hypothetical protein n=1 Tax=Bacillus sp. SD088 TaxID=2782012 RepID=UPI001A9736AC|nr:hypothetical protein [Bacillus sp. SD088]MBO0991816.1 hypothetical protein [Bacillus sp. SD088]
MKTFILSLVGVLMLAGGTIGAKAFHTQHNKEQKEESMATDESSENSTINFPEITSLEDKIDLEKYQIKIVEDHANKRVLLLENEEGLPMYKSILIKKTKRHKVIDLNGREQNRISIS